MFKKGQIITIINKSFEVVICTEVDVQYTALIKEGWTWNLGLKSNGKLYIAFSDGQNFSVPKQI